MSALKVVENIKISKKIQRDLKVKEIQKDVKGKQKELEDILKKERIQGKVKIYILENTKPIIIFSGNIKGADLRLLRKLIVVEYKKWKTVLSKTK